MPQLLFCSLRALTNNSLEKSIATIHRNIIESHSTIMTAF